MYPSSGATIRADLNILVEEAALTDTFLIGLNVMPAFSVDAKAATYPKLQIAEAELMSAGAVLRQADGSYGEVSRKWGSDTYDCLDRGLEERVDDADVKDLSRFFNLETKSSMLTLRNVKLAHEIRVAAAILDTNSFGAATNSGVAYTEANIATISFIADILAAIEKVRDNGTEPDTIVLSSTVYNRVRRATLVANFVSGQIGKGADVTRSSLAQAFADEGIRQVLVGRARYNSAKKNLTKSMTNVWGNTYIWVGKANQNATAMEAGGAGFTLYWNKEGGLFVTETYRSEHRRSNMVRVRQNTAEKIVDGSAGTLIATQYS